MCRRVKSQARRSVPYCQSDSAGQAVLDEIVGTNDIPGQRARIPAQPRDFCLKQPSEVKFPLENVYGLTEGQLSRLFYDTLQVAAIPFSLLGVRALAPPSPYGRSTIASGVDVSPR